jgi:hypothetical protein
MELDNLPTLTKKTALFQRAVFFFYPIKKKAPPQCTLILKISLKKAFLKSISILSLALAHSFPLGSRNCTAYSKQLNAIKTCI